MSKVTQPMECCQISIHENSGYCYASSQQGIRDPKTGRTKFYRIHWGRLDRELRFIPNMRYIYASRDERARLIFPKNWDMKTANEMIEENETETDPSCMHGDEWFLRQIMTETGISRDLRYLFHNNPKLHADFTSLILYFFLDKGRSLNKKNWRMKSSRAEQPYLYRSDVEYMLQSIKDGQYQYFEKNRVFPDRMGPKEKRTKEESRRRRNVLHRIMVRIREMGPNWRNRAGIGILLLSVLQIEDYLERVWKREHDVLPADYLRELKMVRCVQRENKLEFSGKNLEIAEELCTHLKITKWLVFYKNRRRGRPSKHEKIEEGA